MGVRKGWDNLSDNYRNRLLRGGISETSYNTDVPLHGARGHLSPARERFLRETRAFAKEYAQHSGAPIQEVKRRVQLMGTAKGRAYMEQSRRMSALYFEGETTRARSLWLLRDTSLPDYMHYYHGMFGY